MPEEVPKFCFGLCVHPPNHESFLGFGESRSIMGELEGFPVEEVGKQGILWVGGGGVQLEVLVQ